MKSSWSAAFGGCKIRTNSLAIVVQCFVKVYGLLRLFLLRDLVIYCVGVLLNVGTVMRALHVAKRKRFSETKYLRG